MKSTVASVEQFVSTLDTDPEKILQRHLDSFLNNDLDTLMSDYTDRSILITHDQTYSGISEIRSFFTQLLTFFPKGAFTFELDKMVLSGDLAFITWHAKSPALEVPLGTDTFVLKEDKIFQQTFAGVLKFLSKE